MKRGDLLTVALSGDFGKPRPALVIQSDAFADADTVTVALVTSTLIDAPLLRPLIEPTPGNGLRVPSQIMIDKVMTVRRERLGEPFGQLDADAMLTVNRLLALFLGIG